MRNLTNVFIESAPSRFKIPFGINKNVALKAVTNEVRRDKNGVKINKGCYMTFAALDVKDNNSVKAETTFSYFILDKPKFAVLNFTHQFNQLVEIIQAIVPGDNLLEAVKPLQQVLTDSADVFKQVKSTSGVPNAKFVKELVVVQSAISEAFEKAITPYVGENGDLVNLLVVTGTNGQFFELPREDKGFISKMEGGRPLTIDAKYVRWFEDKDKKKKADKDDIGDDEEIISEDELVIDEDQDLEDI
jgi:hypothetical protein